MSEAVIFCPGPALTDTWCGKYTTPEIADRASKSAKPAWRKLPARGPYDFEARYVCEGCFRARTKARVRALLMNGALHDGYDLRGLSPHERQAAAEVLGPEFLAAVDAAWDEGRHDTPPYGIQMGPL